MNDFESIEDGIITWEMTVLMLYDEEDDEEDDRSH